MSYGAIINDMISRMRQNKDLREKSRDRYRKYAESHSGPVYGKSAHAPREEKKPTPEELAYYRKKARKSYRSQRIINIVAVAVGILIIAMLFIIL